MDGAVTERKLRAGSVSARIFADNSIPGTKLADGLNIGGKMINNSIHGSKIVDSSIPGSKIANGTITSGLLAYLDSISGGTASFGGAVNAGSLNANGLLLGCILGAMPPSVKSNRATAWWLPPRPVTP